MKQNKLFQTTQRYLWFKFNSICCISRTTEKVWDFQLCVCGQLL